MICVTECRALPNAQTGVIGTFKHRDSETMPRTEKAKNCGELSATSFQLQASMLLDWHRGVLIPGMPR
jgi:hypothetical protein